MSKTINMQKKEMRVNKILIDGLTIKVSGKDVW
jgi:hypothetical protein